MLLLTIWSCLVYSAFAAKDFSNLIFEEDFSKGINFALWKHEITMSGGGNWEFEYYNNNRTNSYVKDKTLFLKPTLTSDRVGKEQVAGTIPTTIELWGSAPADVCTSNAFYGCSRGSGGGNVLPPIASARVRTANSFSFKYGRLEIQAKLPVGDWIWPAMWLLPEDQAYGQWPASGEIDLMESRGNAAGYAAGGVNCFGSTLHFGPFYPEDPYELAHADKCLESGTLADDFHTYGLVWTESEIYTYLDTDANKVLNLPINSSFWERGGWNKNAALSDPWRGQPDVAPFDQKFYLVFNVAVGGVSGYFPDASAGGKPWSDKSSNAAADFNNNLEAATKTWDLVGDNSALQIRSVKVWQE